ncbi:unnamed protein product [Sympodiomycopsis kandeliae]
MSRFPHNILAPSEADGRHNRSMNTTPLRPTNPDDASSSTLPENTPRSPRQHGQSYGAASQLPTSPSRSDSLSRLGSPRPLMPRRSSGANKANTMLPSVSSPSMPGPDPTLHYPHHQHPNSHHAAHPQHQQVFASGQPNGPPRTTLPPLSTITTRPSSNSLSAIPSASLSLDWDQNRPRAASASSPMAHLRHPQASPYHSVHHLPGHNPMRRSDRAEGSPSRQSSIYENPSSHYSSSIGPYQRGPEPSFTSGGHPYGAMHSEAAGGRTYFAQQQPPPNHRLSIGPPYADDRARAAGEASGPSHARGGQDYQSPSIVVPTGAAAASGLSPTTAGGPSAPLRSLPGAPRPGTGPMTTTHMGGTISGQSAMPLTRPPLEGFSKEEDGRRYRIVVVQSPSRARMCGFGDKDRRPLSPTLIVKLVITDTRTNQDIAPTDVDTSAFFLAADLVHPDDLKAAPRNLLVHQHAASVATDILQQSGLTKPALEASSLDVNRGRTRSLSDPWMTAQVHPTWDGHGYPGGGHQHPHGHSHHGLDGHSTPYTTVTTETYTRNFVGASVASANILKDEHDHLGIFFVLQDLSVRTEGVYRIKLMFANLAGSEGQIKLGVSEALAEAYTEPFTVYTPRRFPGVIEPTPLSKKFAAQGVKIPVRVDRKKRRRDSGEDGDGGYGDEDGDSA